MMGPTPPAGGRHAVLCHCGEWRLLPAPQTPAQAARERQRAKRYLALIAAGVFLFWAALGLAAALLLRSTP